MTTATKNIIDKLETLPENMVNEVKDFIDFLSAKHSKHAAILDNSSDKTDKPKSLYGAAKGLFIIPEDFNKPLDEFKDYM
ncbi:type II toxin-antitoxin system VapB family antitoxin [Pedobacter mendelii]|uniref:DUF2281 domain-containing protein n=1 Tax=Pedobacter mendelii TaxID=1908240 RepID=A0ABQ2BIH9_9SPHI|nr:DUF2281 domain-containing protein [Pedobacter mendelii]GGI27037.1 hypothetical protein GCM10008119_25650 [Pedobacter mendelii]